ncbi:MAG: DUF327 family protein [Spirochaetaceae bacterium]|jgi:uncharacterized protein YaaR (DUF327 family)|nr:DUF327 family protein [Spirochaetaceae bacterium]
MAKIDSPEGVFNAAYQGVRPEAKKARLRGRGAEGASFSRILEDSEVREGEAALAGAALADAPPSEELLAELLSAVHSAGDDLKNRPLPDAIKRYKQAVRGFLHYVVKNGYTVEEQSSRAGLLKRKKYTLVQVADRKLEGLAAAILAGQSGQLDILARIEEINGILVNLLR